MTYLPQLLALAGIFLLACVSPGPDFIAVTSNALTSRSRGLGVAVGTATACSVWAALTVFGLGFVLTRIAALYEAIRLIGAAYLIYLGARMLLGARRPYGSMPIAGARHDGTSAIRTGFLVGITNPKTAAFFGSLFITILPADVPVLVQTAAVCIVAAVALGWFGLLAIVFSTPGVRSAYARLRRPIDALMGAILVSLGLRLAATP